DEPEDTARLMRYFLDIDCAILGAPEPEYEGYSCRIRMEYSFIPFSVYAEGRRRVLLDFLSRDRIYYTDHFYALYEEQARKNISREIETLVPVRPIKIH